MSHLRLMRDPGVVTNAMKKTCILIASIIISSAANAQTCQLKPIHEQIAAKSPGIDGLLSRRYLGGPEAIDPLLLPLEKAETIRTGMFNIVHEGQQGNWQVCQGSMYLPSRSSGESAAKLASYRWRELQTVDGSFRWEILWAVGEKLVMTPDAYKRVKTKTAIESMQLYAKQYTSSANWINQYRADEKKLQSAKDQRDINYYKSTMASAVEQVRSQIKESEYVIQKTEAEWKAAAGDEPFPDYWIAYRTAVTEDIALLKRSLPIEPTK